MDPRLRGDDFEEVHRLSPKGAYYGPHAVLIGAQHSRTPRRVIPAKAGIHLQVYKRSKAWIPVYTGMTPIQPSAQAGLCPQG